MSRDTISSAVRGACRVIASKADSAGRKPVLHCRASVAGPQATVFQTQPSPPPLKPAANSPRVECGHPIIHQEPQMTRLDLAAHRLAAPGLAPRRDGALVRGRALLREWLARSRQRRMLLELDERTLKDIGLTRADVAIEGGKAFWER
ncbi:MAG: DUF1127 domain-containing protein [Burkholderiaceae bacterium]